MRNTPFDLTCEAVGPPYPVTIVWFHNGVRNISEPSPSTIRITGEAANICLTPHFLPNSVCSSSEVPYCTECLHLLLLTCLHRVSFCNFISTLAKVQALKKKKKIKKKMRLRAQMAEIPLVCLLFLLVPLLGDISCTGV